MTLLCMKECENLNIGYEDFIEGQFRIRGEKMMQIATNENQELEKSSVDGIEQRIAEFYEAEERLLKYVYRLEKAEAQKLIRFMINNVLETTKGDKLDGITYYFITLSGIVARHLRKDHMTASKTFDFNEACIMLINNKLTEDNIFEIGDELIEFITYTISDRKPPLFKHHTVNNVLQFVNTDVESAMSVEGISSKFDVSTSHLSRIFREHVGITLVEYINVRKVEEAQYYLRFSDNKISDISDHFHFCNQSYFTRVFKKLTGETPRRFRANIANNYFRYKLPGEE